MNVQGAIEFVLGKLGFKKTLKKTSLDFGDVFGR